MEHDQDTTDTAPVRERNGRGPGVGTSLKIQQACALRMSGASMSEIGRAMGLSKSRVCKLIQQGKSAVIVAAATPMVESERARLQAALAVAERVMNTPASIAKDGTIVPPDPGTVLAAASTVCRLSESLRKLDGLDAPTKQDVRALNVNRTDTAGLKVELDADISRRVNRAIRRMRDAPEGLLDPVWATVPNTLEGLVYEAVSEV